MTSHFKRKKKGLGPEDLIHKNFAGMLWQYHAYKRLHCKWWSYDASGESRSEKTGSLLKSKGLRPGKSDYEFRINKEGISHHIYIEFKTATGRQGDNQKDFEETCDAMNERYYIARSVEEGIGILTKEGILK